MTEATLSLVEPELVLSLFGTCDQHLRTVREALGVSIAHRDGEVRVMGDESAVALATEVLEQLKAIAERRGTLGEDDVARVIAGVVGHGDGETQPTIDVIEVTQTIKPRTAGQARYIEAIRKHDVVFSAGPAGTGKTYLAVALAVEALKNQEIRKIVLVRPAVEAGESLGFLPGDLRAKINPYLRPLLDALHEMIDYDQIQRFMEQDVIEVVPLAYMRGRTLNSAFIILDEAQNTTIAQMKMFLTRMGEGSRIVIAGDPTQVDLPPHARSGLIDALSRLRAVRGIAQIQLSKADIVRHRLVQDIVNAYEESSRGSSKKSRR
ncbi:MAG TPA: PhoH family protein [Pirellulaceae bacterium]|jgi:phosphate starvation-inducible PhoH-like protein|nr:PhoH family protein [Pirellulaceae bacterium]